MTTLREFARNQLKRWTSLGDSYFWAFTIGVVVTQLAEPMRGHSWATLVLCFAMAVIVDVAAAHPWIGLTAAVAVQLWACAIGWAPTVAIGGVVVCAGDALRRRGERRRGAVPWWVAALVAPAVVVLVPEWLHWPASPVFHSVAARNADNAEVILIAAVLLRGEWRSLTNLLTGARSRAEEAEVERDRAAADERARIARELHDVVAHQMSVVVTQAQGAAAVAEADPAQARRALETIASTARNGLVEMRRLVDVDRSAPTAVNIEEPQPGLAYQDYARLADAAEAAGLQHVSFTFDFGDRRNNDVPPGVAVSAYRLIQESITNAAKHSPGSTLELNVVVGDDEVRIDVVNGPPTAPPADIPGSGVGLVGMRERVEFFGGTLQTGPTAAGGWSVRATFPIVPEDPAWPD